MANLFWNKVGKKTLNIVSTPFTSEEEFERVVFETKELLEDIFLIKRQIRGGKKSGIPDIVGIDKNGNVCIVEMKNVTIDSSVIPQVLEYAIWAQNNPDSIKNLWRDSSSQMIFPSIGIIMKLGSSSLLLQSSTQLFNL